MKTYKEFSQQAQLDEGGPLAVLGLLGKGALMGAGAEAVKGLAGLTGNIVKGAGKMARNTLKGEPGEKKKQDETGVPSPDSGLPRAS